MNPSELSDDQKVRLLEHINKKYKWARSPASIKYLAKIELRTNKFIP